MTDEQPMTEEQAAQALQAEKAAYEAKDTNPWDPPTAPNPPGSGVSASVASSTPERPRPSAEDIAELKALLGIDELERAVHELTSHSMMRGIVPADSFLHRWYTKLREIL